MNRRFQSVQGFNDTLHSEITKFQQIENAARHYFELFNFKEIKTPILEPAGLFIRSIGNSTDIIEKEIYTFEDKGGETLSLRPEGTASVVRAYLEHSFDKKEALQRWFYIGPMFRHERPQKGRFRQFYQAGVEVFGIDDPLVDAELIMLANRIVSGFSIHGITIRLNSIGCPLCRPSYIKELKSYLGNIEDKLCDNCKRRINTNPMRTLDCKKRGCITATANAPKTIDYLCTDCLNHFNAVKSALNALRLQYIADTRLVRGLDYYSRTVFEFTIDNSGAQNAILAGGRYDYLVELLGGGHTPAVGFAMGIDRIAEAMNPPPERGLNAFIIPLTDRAKYGALEIAEQLRNENISCEIGYGGKSIKSMMRHADKLNTGVTVIIGNDELQNGYITVKRLSDGHQEKLKNTDITEGIKNILCL